MRQRLVPVIRTPCEGVNRDGLACLNSAKAGTRTCRWHDREVLALRAEADRLRKAALRLAKAAG